MLLLPILLEAILSALIPSQTNLINSIRGTVSSVGSYDLKISKYGTQNVPIYLSGTGVATLQTLVNNHFTATNTPGVSLVQFTTDTVNEYVLAKRKENIKNMLNDYFVGMKMDLGTTLSATFHSSALAYHSSASMLNEIDNLFLKHLSGSSTRSITTLNSPIATNSTQAGSTNFLEVLACVDSLPVSLLNFINSIIVAFMIAILTMHISRERHNGSKQLQLLSGTHYGTYWLSNFLFDWPIYLFNIVTLVVMLKIVDAIKNDPTSETYAIAGGDANTLGYFFLLLLVSSFSWCSYSYIWSFFFKTDIICFVVLLIVLGFAAFLDIIWIFIQLLIVNGTGQMSGGARFMYVIRLLFALVFPNVTIKRGMYDLKIKSNSFCIEQANLVLGGEF